MEYSINYLIADSDDGHQYAWIDSALVGPLITWKHYDKFYRHNGTYTCQSFPLLMSFNLRKKTYCEGESSFHLPILFLDLSYKESSVLKEKC